MSEWISVKDRLPSSNADVLVFEKDSSVPFVGYIDKHGEWDVNKEHYETNGNAIVINQIYQEYVTHWMPLPQLPEDNNNA